MSQNKKVDRSNRQARTNTPGVKGNKQFAETPHVEAKPIDLARQSVGDVCQSCQTPLEDECDREAGMCLDCADHIERSGDYGTQIWGSGHDATVDAVRAMMSANREAELTRFRENTERELAVEAKITAAAESTLSLIEARLIVAEDGIQRVTYDIHEFDNNHLSNNPTSIIDKDGNTVSLAETALDGKLAAALDNMSSQRGLEVMFADNQGRSIHLDMKDAPHRSVLTRELHIAARELKEVQRRADFLENEIVSADRALLAKRLSEAGLPGAKFHVIYEGSVENKNGFKVDSVKLRLFEKGYDPKIMNNDEYDDVLERIAVIANNTYSQTSLRAICKGRGGDISDEVAHSDFNEWKPADYIPAE